MADAAAPLEGLNGSAPRNTGVAHGARVYLRPFEESDITERYLGWFRDPEVTRYLEAHDLTYEEVREHLLAGQRTGSYHLFAICLANTGLHIGNLKIGPIDRRNGVADLVTVLGERSIWHQGYGREAIELGIRVAFERFGIRKLTAGMYEENLASYRTYTAAGFVEEARLRGHYLREGKVQDRIVISCFNPVFFPDRAAPPAASA